MFSWQSVVLLALQHKRKIVYANIIAICAVIASVPIPLLMPLLVDEVLLEQPAQLVAVINSFFPSEWHGPTLYIVVTLFVTLFLRMTMLVLSVMQMQVFTNIAKDITYKMRNKILSFLQGVSMSEYETLGSGSVASHLVTDVNAVDHFIGESVSKSIVAALSLVGISLVLIWMHWVLALFILLMNPMVIYFTVILGKRVKQLKQKENTAFEIFQQSLTETLDAIHEIRANNRERHYFGGVIKKAKDIKTHSAQFSWKSDAANRFSFGVFLFGFDIFRAITMLMVVFSDLSIGQMMAVFGYLWFMMAPVQELLNVQFSFFAAKAALQRLNCLMSLHREPQYPPITNPFKGQLSASIRVENLSFDYALRKVGSDDENTDKVLNQLNLQLGAGEKIALVGASGGGKSTLVQILLGMYAPQKGQIYFNNVPITEIGLDVVRENVATVLQHPAMFNDSVRMNLTLGRNIIDKKLLEALQVAQLLDVVESLPQGLETVVGRQGVRLSGGQRQRLAIARMILSNPKIVIFDEATSALDTETEAKLHQDMECFLKGRTTLIIAHRLSAVKQADRVYVFENGHIIEEGAHDELIQNNGLYNRLYGKRQI